VKLQTHRKGKYFYFKFVGTHEYSAPFVLESKLLIRSC